MILEDESIKMHNYFTFNFPVNKKSESIFDKVSMIFCEDYKVMYNNFLMKFKTYSIEKLVDMMMFFSPMLACK